ncbi:hypothetical protein C8A01DRAFT_15738 [Parachaetomium inaequale]|uniref:FAD dependent oxidoreductase domain-containing protein n=1 Tax=Parachaetomium inaequale TaxID=2588326 RepID=A0AAN6SRG1_9PEZI|nr:hypothetical protein C8A01DRAFT_15738 [Parachaetomium inaequale]
MDRVIIIGTGVFGLSAADHILQRWPNIELSIISRPSPLAPSEDISKIVRIDYNNPKRMEEALGAQREWNSTSFSKFQNEIGRVVIYEDDDLATLEKINNAREEHGLPRRQTGDGTLMQKHFGTGMAPESLTCVFASDDSIVDWETCMADARERAKKACTESSGTFYESGVATIVKDGAHITALQLENGEMIEARGAQVVLAVGPWLAQVLAASDITLPPNGRTPVATGLFSYAVQLDDEQAESLRNKPMVSHNGKGRFFFTDSFTGSFRDGVTETQDPIIARHPEFQNLVCAAGGSFNRAKDLPTIGGVVADVLGGRPVSDRYGWEPKTRDSHHDHPHLVGRGDFATMEKEAQAQQGAQDSAADHLSLAVI